MSNVNYRAFLRKLDAQVLDALVSVKSDLFPDISWHGGKWISYQNCTKYIKVWFLKKADFIDGSVPTIQKRQIFRTTCRQKYVRAVYEQYMSLHW